MNIPATLVRAVERSAEAPALIFNGQTANFRELSERSARWQSALREAGVGLKDRVAVLLPNGLTFADAYFGVLGTGAVFVPLDPNLKSDEISAILADVEPRLLVVDAGFEDTARQALERGELDLPVYRVEAFIDSASSARPYAVPDVADDAVAAILYTSGTVGGPKGVILTADNLSWSPRAMGERFGVGPQDLYAFAVPMSHISGPLLLQVSVDFGMPLLIFERFHPQQFLDLCNRHGVTLTHLVPPMIGALAQTRDPEKFPLKAMRSMLTFGMIAAPEILQRFRNHWPHIGISTGYGLTETGPLVTLAPPILPDDKIGSVGPRVDYAETLIIDDGKPVPDGESGEIVTRGPNVTPGYWRQPELSADMIRDGWFHTGDIGRFDEDGYLWILGRTKDIINVAGLKVYAPEVEDVIYRHPDVAEVAVVGVSGGLKGERVKAVVVRREGSRLENWQVTEHCRALLADYKVPRIVEVRDEPLPRSRTGKINKEPLKTG